MGRRAISLAIGVNPGGLWGSRPPDFGQGGHKILLSYHVQDACSKVVTFEEK